MENEHHEIVFTRHATRRAAERGADIAAVAAMCQRLAPRLSCFSGHRVALVRPGQPIPVVRPRGPTLRILTVLAPEHRVIRSDTLTLRVE